MAQRSADSWLAFVNGPHWQARLRQLDYREPASWPGLLRLALLSLLASAAFVLLWFGFLQDVQEALTQAQQTEQSLKEDYKTQLVKTVNLKTLQTQREQIWAAVQTLEEQLPDKSEMATLLSDINQAGLTRGLQFSLFRPGQERIKDHYAELPITLRITGDYNNMGLFVADVANLSRIVTFRDLAIVRDKEGVLTFDATAQTFRYLDDAELAAAKKMVVNQGQK